MLSITAIAYLAGSKDGSPYLLVEKTTEKNFYTCIQINSEENTAEMALREEINKKISGISSDLKAGTFIASFIDFQENPQKRNRFAIYLFQLPEKFSIPDSYSLLPLDKLESCFEPTLNHGLKLLKHAYQHHLCTSSCSHSVQQKAIAFITRGEGTNTEILMLKKNAVLNNKGKNLGENEVIGGTVENGEDPRIALIREIAEESGIQPQQLNVEDKLTTYQRFNPHTKKINIRHVYHCSVIEPLNKKWSYVVQGNGTDKNDHYDFEFVPLFKPLKVDAGLGQGLDLLKRKILSQSNLKNVSRLCTIFG